MDNRYEKSNVVQQRKKYCWRITVINLKRNYLRLACNEVKIAFGIEFSG
jgi:hypothetical protein